MPTKPSLTGKTALVLGANRGIGRCLALELARRGATVMAGTYDWPADTASLTRQLQELGSQHRVLTADLQTATAVEEFFTTLRQHCSTLDFLINNLERGGMPVVHGPYTEQQWDLEINTTLKAKWWVMRQALPLLQKTARHRDPAAVVVISSIAGQVGRSGPAGLIFNDAYAAANRALASFTATWAREGAPTVRVNELMLGLIKTRHAEETRGWGLLSEEQRRTLHDHTLLGRSGDPEEVVKAALFLLTEATYMTGSTLRLDGGYLLGGERVPPMPPGIL
ncbi:SDR family NAD(P)-dependent oxidoreductase [Desulfurivibrio alkaliphilus]|uniref:Short-chain dehydrogenase/reductase SDR n=1 Tax=Desulfurivibrio alkaliphilus (strain DSM 19089 / UNIQEM U267 / AHT2) TaxID=589865 RepID=D6Z4A8_DESAT|nr:SDR family oxidoreductase [Desulfurivibrio alkaliphilus]ADH86383.1 short-chain dehydrogenase/reductase SDR [Desulfurivibrio alkaliphilus AHT 2]